VKPIEICILGCGAVARLHSRVARSLGGAVRLSFASRDAARAEQYRQKYGGRHAFGSYEAACAHPDIDAVFICTPTGLHVAQAKLAARSGKGIVIEKPAARSVAELDLIRAAVQNHGVVAAVAENYRFKPLLRVLRSYIDRGDIGTPQYIEISRAGRNKTGGWREDAELMGGGALLEGGVHWIHLLCELGGTPRQVVAARPTPASAPVAPVEDSLDLLVSFDGGPVGRLFHSWNTTTHIFGLGMSRILGTDGNIHFESNGVFATVLGRRYRFRLPGFRDLMGYRGMWRHLVTCLREGREPEISLDVARRDLAVVEAAYRSLETAKFEAV
jgi:UDP-N-acetylglucosamine 3-dehydrogenase